MYKIGFVTTDGNEHFFDDIRVKVEDAKAIVCEPWEVPYDMNPRGVLLKQNDKTFYFLVHRTGISMYIQGMIQDLRKGEVLHLRFEKHADWVEYRSCEGEPGS